MKGVVKKEELTAIPNSAIDVIVRQHYHLKFMWIFVITVIILLSALIAWVVTKEDKARAYEYAMLTDVKSKWTLRDKGVIEQKETYRNFMLNVHRVYGVKYQKGSVRTYGMSTKTLSYWIDLNWDLQKLFGFDPYLIPVMQIMESALDPYAPGPCGEKGIGQIKWGTVGIVLIEFPKMNKGMQNRIKRLCSKYNINIHFTTHEELTDPLLCTMVQAMLLWTLRNEFDYNEQWYTSIYHWGGFLYRFYKKGTGQMPVQFTINDIKYNVGAYYIKLKQTMETFNEGQLEPSKIVLAKWRATENRLRKEEVALNSSYKVIKKLEQKYKKLENSHKGTVLANKEMEKSLKSAKAEFRKIYGEIKNFRDKDIRVVMKKGKGVVRTWQKEMDKQTSQNFYFLWLAYISGILLLLLIYSFLSWKIGNRLARKRKERKLSKTITTEPAPPIPPSTE